MADIPTFRTHPDNNSICATIEGDGIIAVTSWPRDSDGVIVAEKLKQLGEWYLQAKKDLEDSN